MSWANAMREIGGGSFPTVADRLGALMPAARALSLGRSFFGIATTASGVLQLVTGRFVRLVPTSPTSVATHTATAYLAGGLLVVAGLAILSGWNGFAAARLVGALLAVVLLLYVRRMAVEPVIMLRGSVWTAPLKTLALGGGAAILARGSPDSGRASVALGSMLLAIFLLVTGLEHFAYTDFVAQLIPSWIPERRFWTYFAGVALIAGGAGILVPPTVRLAATLSALMIFLWVPLVHIPLALAGPKHAAETAGIFEALAISGVALLVAGTRALPRRSAPARPSSHDTGNANAL